MQCNNLWIIRIVVILSLLIFTSYAFAHGMSDSERQSIIGGGALAFLWLGATHMLTGYDHLLFIFGVVFFLAHFFDVVKYVTAFTIGHTITLILATYYGLQINYFLIDAFIALSVVYIAFVNLQGFQKYFDRDPPNLLLMVTFIGLVHVLGLSTRLQELPLDTAHGLLLQIISFNIGVEVGQIIALAIMLLIIRLFRGRSEANVFSTASNVLIGVFGFLLFLGQMHGYSHVTNPDEFGFSEDLHHHAHLKDKPQGMPEFKMDDILFEDPEPQHGLNGVHSHDGGELHTH